MKALSVLAFLPLLASCTATNLTKMTREAWKGAASDHNTFILEADTIYGKGKVIRIGDSTNSTVSVTADGTVTQTPLHATSPTPTNVILVPPTTNSLLLLR